MGQDRRLFADGRGLGADHLRRDARRLKQPEDGHRPEEEDETEGRKRVANDQRDWACEGSIAAKAAVPLLNQSSEGEA